MHDIFFRARNTGAVVVCVISIIYILWLKVQESTGKQHFRVDLLMGHLEPPLWASSRPGLRFVLGRIWSDRG